MKQQLLMAQIDDFNNKYSKKLLIKLLPNSEDISEFKNIEN